jgi:predicted CXXCH cytochrome family protein
MRFVFQRAGRTGRGLRQRVQALALLGVACIAGAGCAVEQRYRVMSFFLDGVPPPGTEEPVEMPQVAAATSLEEPADILMALAPRTQRRADFSKHEAYDQKQCLDCHAGRFTDRLSVDLEELCWTCHAREDFPGEVVHGPVAGGSCTGCHNPHTSPYEKLLVQPTATLCERCHDDDTFPGFAQHRAREGEDCVRCHDPHSADREFMLGDEVDRS